MEYFEIGSCFRTYNDLVKKLNKYSHETNTKFFKKDSRFITPGVLNDANKLLVYSEIRFNCIHRSHDEAPTSSERK